MERIKNIKNINLAVVLMANWLVDIIIGCILLFGLGKIDEKYMISTLVVDAIFMVVVYFFEYIKKNDRYDVWIKGFIVAKNIYLVFYYMEHFCGSSKNVNPLDIRFLFNGLIYVAIMVFLFAIFYWLPATVIAFNVFTFIKTMTSDFFKFSQIKNL